MAELIPFPFGKLVTRMFRELEKKESIFDLPAKKFFLGERDRDFSVKFHHKIASSPLGPASGPQSQMAQNLVLCWLGGSRIMELKTVQILDELKIPRPCIDMQTVGYNVEWSQELKVQQSLEEYVKGAMLIKILSSSGKLKLAPGFEKVIFDLSIGYDFQGIRSEKVQSYIRGMQHATPTIDKLRSEIPEEYREFRNLDFDPCISDTMTLSTFHGCPPDEIEKIIDFCLKQNRLHCIIKLNPVLLGKKRTRELFNEVLGYQEIHIPDQAFDADTQWNQAVEMAGRLSETAKSLGLGFGVKFSNTLIVENHRNFFPKSEKVMYLSGTPLHVLAMNLVLEWRKVFGADATISFAAGMDRFNFPDAVSLGLTPLTTCSDLLKTGGYQRQAGYFEELTKKMEQAKASTIGDFILRAHGQGKSALMQMAEIEPHFIQLAELLNSDLPILPAVIALAKNSGKSEDWGKNLYEQWVKKTALLNTFVVVPQITAHPRYSQKENVAVPRKTGTKLSLFNCITCDKCVPVCPNDANFTYTLPQIEIPIKKIQWQGGKWQEKEDGKLVFNKKHQIANFQDFCNECGNCDVFCPEDGGPYVMKPRFFGGLETWKKMNQLDGFYLERQNKQQKIWGRFQGKEYFLELHPLESRQASPQCHSGSAAPVRLDSTGEFHRVSENGEALFKGEGFSVKIELKDDKVKEIVIEEESTATMEIDLTYFHILRWLAKAIFSENEINYANL